MNAVALITSTPSQHDEVSRQTAGKAEAKQPSRRDRINEWLRTGRGVSDQQGIGQRGGIRPAVRGGLTAWGVGGGVRSGEAYRPRWFWSVGKRSNADC